MIAATLLGAATLVVAIVGLSEGVAINPWEPAIAMGAMRLNAGLPVYQPGVCAAAGVSRIESGQHQRQKNAFFTVLAIATHY